MKYRFFLTLGLSALTFASCEKQELTVPESVPQTPEYISLDQVAHLLSTVPIGSEQMEEVHHAVSSSAGNGYDEEYRMRDLFAVPGSGVGDTLSTKAPSYTRPLRELLREAVLSTKADEGEGEAWLDSLSTSDIQIYWPFSEQWQGSGLPVITYDTGDGAPMNEGYQMQPDGSIQKVMVDEQMALEKPVWVVNYNSDAYYKSLEMLRREDPTWGTGGGEIVVTKAGTDFKTLVLRSFKTTRQFDSWLAGGSEFFCRMGSVNGFKASTEAEMRLYQPSITDFMIVVRRKQMGEILPFNAVLVSEWTGKMESCAFIITEDDGGTRTTWKCNAAVKVNSKTYGFEIEIPINARDDIVWRGALTRGYIEKNSGKECRFGDVELVLELI